VSKYLTGRASSRPLPLYLLKRLGYRAVLSSALKKSEKIIVPSNSVKQDLINMYPAYTDKIRVTYESGELEIGRKTDTKIEHKNYFLYVGNAHPHKNLQRLIRAFSSLIKDYPQQKLVLIGKRDFFYKKLEKYIQDLSLGENIVIQFNVDNSNLSSWYRNAQALVFPSLSEGFGIPGLEAMHCGCPVLASDITVFREIYGQAAMYFDPSSSLDIAAKIRKFIEHPDSKQVLVHSGYNQVKKYSWRKMAKETLQIYESCAGV
jgi:glycosyltransferase involved in cell wall biosynthesis